MKSSKLVKQYKVLWDMVAQVRKAILNIKFKEDDLDEIIRMSMEATTDMNHFIFQLKHMKAKKDIAP